MKRIIDRPVAEYQRLAKRMDQRFSAEKSWTQLPLQHAPGRPRTGEKRETLEVHSIKVTAAEWKSLQTEATARGISINALIRSVLRPASLPRVIAIAELSA